MKLTPEQIRKLYREPLKFLEEQEIVAPEVYKELVGRARQYAQAIQRVNNLEAVQSTMDILRRHIVDGGTLRSFQEAVSGGKIDLGLPAYRVENIYRTNVQTAFMQGHVRRQEEPDAVARRPYFMYDAVNDSRTRPAHAAMHGHIARHDDPIWSTWTPPCGYQSLLPDQTFAGAVEVGLKARYSGPAVEIVMKSGARLRVTAQHPVLTVSGWKDAGELGKGDRLLCYADHVGVGNSAVSPDGEEKHRPMTAEDAFKALSSGGVVSVPAAAFNLNGDVEFIQNDVDVVAANSSLRSALESGILEMLDNLGLKRTDNGQIVLPNLGADSAHSLSGDRVFPLTGGARGSHVGDSANPFRPHALELGGGCVWFDPVRFQKSRKPFSVDAIPGSDLFERHAALVERDGLARDLDSELGAFLSGVSCSVERGLFVSGSLSARVRDMFIGGFDINPGAAGDIIEAHPGLIEADEVVDARLFEFSGHVYDFQCANGLIIAQGGVHLSPIISNCRCRRIALSERQATRRGYEIGKQPPDVKPDPGWDYDRTTKGGDPIKRGIEQSERRALESAPAFRAEYSDLPRLD